MSSAIQTRRERIRADTARDIKAVALRLMAEGGTGAITLRAIAREMGMTAGAIYSYYATRDELITALILDVYTSLMDFVEAARDARPRDDTAGRLLAWGHAFRDWAIDHPEGFRLVYGDAITGYRAPPAGPAPEAARRACAGLTELVADAWPHAGPLQPPNEHQWSDFSADLVASVRGSHPDLPPAALALALRVWGRLHGLVSLEVYGHLRGQARNPASLYRAELCELIRSLGLPDPPTRAS